MPTVNDYLQLMLAAPTEKLAFPGQGALGAMGRGMADFGKGVAQNAQGALGTGLGVAAATGVGLAASKAYDMVTKHQDFNAMLGSDMNQDVRAHHEQDPARVNQMFTTLRTMNPQFSKDPLVAGSYLRRMLDTPTAAGGIATEALQHRDSFPSIGMEAFSRGALEGGKATMQERLRQPGEDRAFKQREDQFNAQHGQRDTQFDRQMDFNSSREEMSHDQRERQMAMQAQQGNERNRMGRQSFRLQRDTAVRKAEQDLTGVPSQGGQDFITRYKTRP